MTWPHTVENFGLTAVWDFISQHGTLHVGEQKKYEFNLTQAHAYILDSP